MTSGAQAQKAPGKRTPTDGLVQRRAVAPAATGEDETQAIASDGVRGGGGALPHGDTIAASFGRYAPVVEGVRAHVGGAAADASAAIGAEAYATGNSIAFATAPELGLAAHEAAHVVQQARGVHLKGGVGQAGDVYEQHADAVAAEVVAGRSAEPLLEQMAGGGTTGVQHQVQRKDVPTHYGTFKSTTFAKTTAKDGVDAVVEFHPDETKIDAKKIGLTQSVKVTHADASHTAIDPTKEGRRVQSGGAEGYTHDRISTRNNPVYGAPNVDAGAGEGLDKTAADNNTTADPTSVGPTGNATFQLGYAYTEGADKKKKEAALYDAPNGGSKSFETAALGLEGHDAEKYFGSVKWGYQADATATDVTIADIELASMGVPTQNFLASAKLWNGAKTRGTLEVTANPAKAKSSPAMTAVDVAKGTKLRQLDEYELDGKNYVEAETLDSASKYYVLVTDLKDTQDGGATVAVPVPMVFVNAAPTPLFSDMQMTTKVKDLPANTRMENTLCTIHGSYGMRIVDGADLGQTGFVDETKIQREV